MGKAASFAAAGSSSLTRVSHRALHAPQAKRRTISASNTASSVPVAGSPGVWAVPTANTANPARLGRCVPTAAVAVAVIVAAAKAVHPAIFWIAAVAFILGYAPPVKRAVAGSTVWDVEGAAVVCVRCAPSVAIPCKMVMSRSAKIVKAAQLASSVKAANPSPLARALPALLARTGLAAVACSVRRARLAHLGSTVLGAGRTLQEGAQLVRPAISKRYLGHGTGDAAAVLWSDVEPAHSWSGAVVPSQARARRVPPGHTDLTAQESSRATHGTIAVRVRFYRATRPAALAPAQLVPLARTRPQAMRRAPSVPIWNARRGNTVPIAVVRAKAAAKKQRVVIPARNGLTLNWSERARRKAGMSGAAQTA